MKKEFASSIKISLDGKIYECGTHTDSGFVRLLAREAMN
jgi:hypothetical protein